MASKNLELVNSFFAACAKHDLTGIRMVMADDASWTFSGQHLLAGVKHGIPEIVAFFDTMVRIMGMSNP